MNLRSWASAHRDRKREPIVEACARELTTRAKIPRIHPNIVTLHSIEEAQGTRFVTMELWMGRVSIGRSLQAGYPRRA